MDQIYYKAYEHRSHELAVAKLPGPYDSLYKSSYSGRQPTYQLSPLYHEDRLERLQRYDNDPQRRPRSYRDQEYEDHLQYSPRYGDQRFESRNSNYRETPRDYYDGRRNTDREQRSPSPRQREERSNQGSPRRPFPSEYYYDQLVREPDKDEPKPIYCDGWHSPSKPFDVVISKLACSHKYCPQCFENLEQSENITRHGEVLPHYRCNICKHWTSIKRVVKLDSYGRRLGFV